MRLRGQNYRAAFILGAGATRGAVDHVRVHGKMLRPPLNRDFFAIARSLGQAYGPASAQMRRVQRLERAFRTDFGLKHDPPMETAFGLLYMAKDLPQIFKTGPGPKPSAGHRPEIDDFLKILFEILCLIDRGSDHNGYDRLATSLTSEDTLITLNYDTALDSALVRSGWDPRTGYSLSGGSNKVSWQSQNAVNAHDLSGLKLLKLHGSTNWWVRGSTTNLKKVFESKPVRVTKPRMKELNGHVRQIIPPIYGKVFGHDNWRHLWKEAYDSLCGAEVLAVVGCSLADTDFHLPAFLNRVAAIRKKDGRFKRVILVNSVRVRRRWREVLRGSFRTTDVRSHPRFETFLSKELKA